MKQRGRKAPKRRTLTVKERQTIENALDHFACKFADQPKRDELAALAHDVSVSTVLLETHKGFSRG